MNDERFPKTKEQPCQFCGKTLHLTRQGVAPVYASGFKVPNRGTGYGYSAKPHECYLTIRLQRSGSFWRRLVRAFSFLFRPAGFYGEYEEFILDDVRAREMRDALNVFLAQKETLNAK